MNNEDKIQRIIHNPMKARFFLINSFKNNLPNLVSNLDFPNMKNAENKSYEKVEETFNAGC